MTLKHWLKSQKQMLEKEQNNKDKHIIIIGDTMFPNVPGGFNLSRLLGGISKSLNVANQVIPIYQQLSPMVQNARRAFGALKEMSNGKANNPINNMPKKMASSNNMNQKRTIINSSNNPSFFQ